MGRARQVGFAGEGGAFFCNNLVPQRRFPYSKLFAYLLLLEDPEPAPLLGIEEPENGLHHQLLMPLADRMRRNATRGSQTFVTTHSPFFVDALSPDDVFAMRKLDGLAQIRRLSEMDAVNEMVAEGIPLGSLWYSDHFGFQGHDNGDDAFV